MRLAAILALLVHLAGATAVGAVEMGKELSRCPKGYQFEKGYGCMRPGCGAIPPTCGNLDTPSCVDHKWQCQTRSCPTAACAAAPEGCWYGPPGIGNDGCKMGCGQLACDPERKCEHASFPGNCPADRRVDCSNGQWVCQPKQCAAAKPVCANPKRPVCEDGVWACKVFTCPTLRCPAPPADCQYGPPYPTDQNDCRVGCGEVTCKVVCPILKCDPAPDYCHYGPRTKDADGCDVDCGQLICAEGTPLRSGAVKSLK
jgi:hypothetical protein